MKKLDHPYWIKIENITGDSGEVFAKSMAMSSSRNRANELSQALAWSAPFSTISSLASWTKLAQVAKLDDEAPQQDAPKGAQKDKHAKKRN